MTFGAISSSSTQIHHVVARDDGTSWQVTITETETETALFSNNLHNNYDNQTACMHGLYFL